MSGNNKEAAEAAAGGPAAAVARMGSKSAAVAPLADSASSGESSSSYGDVPSIQQQVASVEHEIKAVTATIEKTADDVTSLKLQLIDETDEKKIRKLKLQHEQLESKQQRMQKREEALRQKEKLLLQLQLQQLMQQTQPGKWGMVMPRKTSRQIYLICMLIVSRASVDFLVTPCILFWLIQRLQCISGAAGNRRQPVPEDGDEVGSVTRALEGIQLQPSQAQKAPRTPERAASVLDHFRSPPKRLDGVEIREGMDEWLLERPELQTKILAGGKRVLVTAPPGSGKTSLIQLLMRTLQQQGKKVLRVSTLTARTIINETGVLATDVGSTAPLTAAEVAAWWKAIHLQSDLHCTPDVGIVSWDYIIVDDAQRLYPGLEFWNNVIKEAGTASILFFASTAMESVMTDTPAVPCKVSHRHSENLHEKRNSVLLP
jgi:hypothetical protein